MQSSLTLRKGYRTAKRPVPQTFAAWCSENAAGLILPLKLNADIVAWIVAIMKSAGAMDGIENISTLEKVLKLHRTGLRFPPEKELDWEIVLLTARVLLRTWEQGVVA